MLSFASICVQCQYGIQACKKDTVKHGNICGTVEPSL